MYALSRCVTSVTNELLQSVRGPGAVTGARDRGQFHLFTPLTVTGRQREDRGCLNSSECHRVCLKNPDGGRSY